MDIPSPAYAAIGTISAAIIAGGISFISTVLAKDQKTSEFRQAWIDGLRNDIAELISLFILMTGTVQVMSRQGKTPTEIDDRLAQKDDALCKLEMVYARIKLRINPSEHIKILSALSALQTYAGSEQKHDAEVADALVDDLVKESQLVLKREWKRVKSGELAFKLTKWVSLLVLIGAVVYLGVEYRPSH